MACMVCVVCLGGNAACGGAPSAVEAPASSSPPPRRPDAVVVEPPPAIPAPVAHADARGVVSLREPLGGDALRDVVEQLADAWQRGSLEALVALLTSDAGTLDGRTRGRGPLVEGWRQRLHAHEYARLAGTELFRLDRVERWTWDELGASDAPARPSAMRPDEIYVRIPVEVTHIANEKVFDDVVVMVLRLEEGKYKIAGYGEQETP
ncbi:MAG TPA: hypothetical protein VGG39_25895 [Polyangiaceae bacterium]